MRQTRRLARVLAVMGVGLLAGCGGSAPEAAAPGTGYALITVLWPATERLIPAASQSIRIELVKPDGSGGGGSWPLDADGAVLAAATVSRPTGGGETTTQFSELPVGQLVARAQALPAADGTGTAQALAWSSISIKQSEATPLTLTLSSAIKSVSIQSADVSVGGTVRLSATARDQAGRVVLVPPTKPFTWEITTGGGVASIDDNGLLTGLAEGLAAVRATEKESGVSGVAIIDVAPQLGRYRWTVMVFMNADNDLEGFGVQDVNELERLPDSDDVAIVVLMDRIRGYDTSNNNWTDARRFQIRHDEDTTTMTSAKSPDEGGSATVLGEIDAGNAAVVKSFIEYCQTNFPATNYVFDFWNHGAGWRKHAGATLTRGVLYDDTQRTNVQTTDLDDILNVTSKVDIAMFDASLMQMMEVAYQIRNRCDLVVGSEESPPGEGYPYDSILDMLISNPDTTPETLAAHIVNATVDAMGTTFELTQSALRTDKLADLADAISAYGDLLRSKDGTFHSEIAAARTSAQRYGSGVSLYEGFRDLIDFCDQVSTRTNDPALIAGRTTVRNALTAALVAERHSGSGLSNSHGLSIFIPSSSDWSTLRSKYLTTDFAINARWDDWLDDFYNVP